MLVSNLKFDTSPTEDSGLGCGGGVWKAAPTLPIIKSKDGKSCAYFNGSSGLTYSITSFPNIDAYKDDWTIQFLFNTAISSGTNHYVIAKYRYTSGYSNYDPLIIFDSNGTINLSGDRSPTNSTMSYNLNEWNSFSMIHTNHTIYFYLNMVLDHTTTETSIGSSSLSGSFGPFSIGNFAGYPDGRYIGYMSDFRIYKGEAIIPVNKNRIYNDSDKNYYGVKA